MRGTAKSTAGKVLDVVLLVPEVQFADMTCYSRLTDSYSK